MITLWVVLGIIALVFLAYAIFWLNANFEPQTVPVVTNQRNLDLPSTACTQIAELFDRKNWWRGVVHFHTTVSPDSKGTFEEARADAKKLGLDFLISTDHDRLPTQAEYPADGTPPIIVGQEVYAQHSSGSLIAWNITQDLPTRTYPQPKLHELVKSQGGVDVLIHHANPKYNRNPHNLPECQFDGFEIINVYDLAITRPPKVIINWLAALPWLLIGRETDNLLCLLLEKSITKYHQTVLERRCTLIGGNDTHIYRRYGKVMLPTYRLGFNLVQNWVWRSSPNTTAQPTAQYLADSLLAGRWLVSLYPHFKQLPILAVFNADWSLVGIIGDEIKFSNGLKLVVKLPNHKKALINIYGNGELISSFYDNLAIFEITQPGVYKVDIYRVWKANNNWVVRKRPWILFNPVYIREN